MNDTEIVCTSGEHSGERQRSFEVEFVEVDGRLFNVFCDAHKIVDGIVQRIEERTIAVELFLKSFIRCVRVMMNIFYTHCTHINKFLLITLRNAV